MTGTYPRSHEPDLILNTLHTFLSMPRTEGSARTLQVCRYVLRVSPLTRRERRRRWLRPRRSWPQGILGVKFGWPRLDALPIRDEIAIAGSPPAVAVKEVHREHHGGCRSSGRRHGSDERRRNRFRGVSHLHRSRKLFVPNPAVFEEGKSSFTFPAGAPAVPLTWWRHDARRGPRLRPCRCHRPW